MIAHKAYITDCQSVSLTATYCSLRVCCILGLVVKSILFWLNSKHKLAAVLLLFALVDTFDDERYYQSITPTPALPVPVTLQAVAPATAATTVITSDNTFQSEYIPVPRDDRYEFPGMMPRDTRMYETGLVAATDNAISNPVPLYRDERHYYPVSTITSSYILDNRQYEQSINSPSMMHDRLYQPTTHTITSGMLYNDRHYETANSIGSLSNLASANDCHGVEMMMRQDAAAAAAAAVIEHGTAAEVAWGRAEMERQDEIDRQYLVLLPREDKIEPQDEL